MQKTSRTAFVWCVCLHKWFYSLLFYFIIHLRALSVLFRSSPLLLKAESHSILGICHSLCPTDRQ